MTGAAPSQSLVKADYLISAQVLYSDAKSRESGGGIGGAFGSAVGLKTKTLESQVLLSLIDVDTGLQEAVATGSARKKDVGVVGGGLLLGLGVGALGGTYGSTDIGKITSIAVLDALPLPGSQRVGLGSPSSMGTRGHRSHLPSMRNRGHQRCRQVVHAIARRLGRQLIAEALCMPVSRLEQPCFAAERSLSWSSTPQWNARSIPLPSCCERHVANGNDGDKNDGPAGSLCRAI